MIEEKKNTEHKSNTPVVIRDLWQTPCRLFETLNKEFNFTTDVASSHENHLCDHYFTNGEHESAFDNHWGKVNWCNPPYSNITPWVEEDIFWHKEEGIGTVMLVPADTSVKWFKRAYESCNEVRFISGRISFINAETQEPVNGNNKGSVLFIWRGHCKSHCVSLVDREDLLNG